MEQKKVGNLTALRGYRTTDMAAELYRTAEAERRFDGISGSTDRGISYQKTEKDGVMIEKLTVFSEVGEKLLGKSIGTYYTIHTGELRLLGQEDYDACCRALRGALTEAISILLPGYRVPTMVPGTPISTDTVREQIGEDDAARLAVSPEWDRGGHLTNSHFSIDDPGVTCITEIPPEPLPVTEQEPLEVRSVLAVGLGNPELTPDAYGTLCVRSLNVTRHLVGEGSPLPEHLRSSLHALSAFCPMVLGQTGIETLSLVKGAVDAVRPDLVILLDALAASSAESLGQTIQISTTGIHPGGGVGNQRQALTRETLGVPTLTIGVPTVIAASSMILGAMEDAGFLPPEESGSSVSTIKKILEDNRGSYVAPKDADMTIREFARLTARVLNGVILGEETAAEWFRRV
ncbi:MAG: GPR endopeptidase [Clostridia bacterium]|nr:GPR endopeptidase [Clostridia bacterium]